METDKTAIMLLREIHAAVYGNGRAGLQERVTRLEENAKRTPKVKTHVLKFTIGSGAITGMSNLFHLPMLTYTSTAVFILAAMVWFMLDRSE